MRQFEFQFTDSQDVSISKFRAIMISQINLRMNHLVRGHAYDLLVPEYKQAVVGLNGMMIQNQVIFTIPAHPNYRPVIFEIDVAESCAMVSQFKHRWFFQKIVR
jgi:hypothetical protein